MTVDTAFGTTHGHRQQATGSTGTDTFTGVNAVQGSMFDDTLLGSSVNNTFTGLAGDDFIDGRGGFDHAPNTTTSTYTTGGSPSIIAAGTRDGRRLDRHRHAALHRRRSGYQLRRHLRCDGLWSAQALSTSATTATSTSSRVGWQRHHHRQRQHARDLLQRDGRGDHHDRRRRRRLGAWDGAGDAAGVGNDTFNGGVNSAIGSNFADVYNATGFIMARAPSTGIPGPGLGNDTITGNGNTQIASTAMPPPA